MMNVFRQIKNSIDERRLERLRGDLMKIVKTEFGFDALAHLIPESISNAAYEQDRVVENLVWFSGKEIALIEYYKNGTGSSLKNREHGELRTFWTTAPGKVRRLHTGVPREIAKKQSTILFGNGYSITATAFKKAESGKVTDHIDAQSTRHCQEILDQFRSKIRLNQLLAKCAQANSWSGHIAIKLGFDFKLSPFPIAQVYDRRNFELIQSCGLTTAIVFHNYFKVQKKNVEEKYRHDEVYSTNDYGYATITNRLFEIRNSEIREIGWEIAQSKFPQFEGVQETITFKTKGMLALDLPNLPIADEHYNNPYGASDYDGAIGSFDALDEAYSTIVREMRDKRSLRFLTEQMMKIDPEGNIEYDDGYTTNFKKIADLDNDQQMPEFKEFTDITSAHIEKFKIFLMQACNACGISPISLGVTGLESIQSSDKSTRERCKTTIETRNAKLELWKPFLEELMIRMLEFTSELQTKPGYPNSGGIPKIEIDWDCCNISVTFPDYVVNGIEERIGTWGNAKQMGVASLEETVEEIHPDWTKEEIRHEIDLIKFENGLSDQNPNLLQLDIDDEAETDR